jgi:hypothetical protein
VSAAGERVRLIEQIDRMRALLHGLHLTVNGRHPCSESAQAVADAAVRLVAAAGRHDAYQRSEGPITIDEVREALKVGAEQRKAAEKTLKRSPRR